jgi:2-oxoglutarate dehydrogenase complex dehydrogenase (E1) component-like enzyme
MYYVDSEKKLTLNFPQVQLLVRAYQVRGHHVAELDPLGILDADLDDVHPPELELSRYGFTERDLDKEITLGPGILPHFATDERKTMKLGEIIKLCKRIYCACPSSNSNSALISFITRWRCWYSICPHSRQRTVRLDP